MLMYYLTIYIVVSFIVDELSEGGLLMWLLVVRVGHYRWNGMSLLTRLVSAASMRQIRSIAVPVT